MTEDRQEAARSGTLSPASIADGREHRLDPRCLTSQRIAGGVATTALSGASLLGLMGLLVASSPTRAGAWLILAAWLLGVAALAALSYGWPALRYRHVGYRVGADGIRIRRGVLWRSTVSVPRSRVQHTDVQQGPIERSLGLATLVIHTAGTQHASIRLSGLAREVALRIRDHLIGEEGANDA